ncbi:flagellar motor switch phosphatase FliY [Paenalkalicoccus suaedae]|uniref:Flagellar motor switch phosphatase FliY n=1 Tax=Paenalkalicoccus suaedae TaxID=2592382 RepID=A0A859FF12_9BACI|nr:flagellar motor switch phosphatase FliY [Paenalkalicoccus suaedae]QKS71428.1 flagellar motor switch phosphatase FliY [Paenalkalicoccus suaedae]
MNDDMLSQDEINALLNGMDDDDDTSSNEESEQESSELNEADINDYLTPIEQDALGEIGNISFGSSATALSTLLNQKVDITTPKVSAVKRKDLEDEFPIPHVAVSVEYTVGFEGLNLLVIKTSDAAIIADLMLGNDGTNIESDELGEMELSAVQEAMNQMMGSASTSMSTIFNQKVDISPPGIEMMNLQDNPNGVKLPDEDVLIKISFDLKVGELIDSKIMQLVTVSFAKNMVDKLMNPQSSSTDEEELIAEVEEELQPTSQPEQVSQPAPSAEQPNREPERAQAAERGSQLVSRQAQIPDRDVNVQPAAFSNFEAPSLSDQEARNLDMLMEIPLEVTVELGRTKRSIKEILELSHGSIIELDKLAGEPVDILVNQRLIAKGEVVVIDENFGVRVTDIVSRQDRLKNLK